MTYPAFLSLAILVVILPLVIQGLILHFVSVRWRFKNASPAKTVGVLGLLAGTTIAIFLLATYLAARGGMIVLLNLALIPTAIVLPVIIIKLQYRARLLQSILILVIMGLVGAGISLPTRAYVIQPFRIPTGAMAPSVVPGDYVLASKFHFRTSAPARGDIAVYDNPRGGQEQYVKRIMGLPGETVEIRDRVVLIDGQPVDDPWGTYDPQGRKSITNRHADSFGPVAVPPDHYFMLGDTRDNSLDSRFIGCVSEELLVGKVMMRYWPLARMGRVP